MLLRLDVWLDRQSTPVLLLIVLCLILVLGIVDYSSGKEISFSVFYTGPIMLAAWYGGRRVGLLSAVVSACVWLLADIAAGQHYSREWIPYWNTIVRLGFFLIILELLLGLRDKLSLEESLADTDPLTGLANRRAFQEKLELEASRARRYQEKTTIAYLDLDNFKQVNDTFGHDTGDELLKIVASTIQKNTRDSDYIARLGGDEFAILFPLAGREAAESILKKLREELLVAMRQYDWPVTFSIGAITFEQQMNSTRDMIKKVDDLMYQVKKSGKDNVLHVTWPA